MTDGPLTRKTEFSLEEMAQMLKEEEVEGGYAHCLLADEVGYEFAMSENDSAEEILVDLLSLSYDGQVRLTAYCYLTSFARELQIDTLEKLSDFELKDENKVIIKWAREHLEE